MAANVDGWKRFDDPRFELMLRYPDPTPDQIVNPGLPHISGVGLARFGLVMGSGVLMAAVVAFLSDSSSHRTTEPAA